MKQWYAVRSKSKRESVAASLLTSARIDVYVPRAPVRHDDCKPPVVEPLFPGYFFARLDPLLAEIRLANYTAGVRYVVGYGGEPCPVPDDLILYLQQRVARTFEQGTGKQFCPGDRIVITSGPLRGIEGIFDQNMSATGRVRILIQVLNRLCPADVPARHLQLIAQAVSTASG